MRFLLTLVLAITTGVMAKASDFVVDGIHYKILDPKAKTVEVTRSPNSNEKYSGDIVIPATIEMGTDEFSVVAVGDYAFDSCVHMSSVIIGDNIEKIGYEAFSRCNALKEISLDGKVKIIDNGAFMGCVGLLKLEIPSNVEEIRQGAFYGCHGLTQLIIHNGVKIIGDVAFALNEKITELSIPASVECLGQRCFSASPYNGVKVLRIEDGVKKLEMNDILSQSELDKCYIGRDDVDDSFTWGPIKAKEITIGRNVTNLKWLFCLKLETLNLHCTTPPTCSAFNEVQYADVKVNVPAGCLEAYQKAEPWCHFKSIQDTLPAAIDEVEADKDEVVAVYAIDGTPCTMNDRGVKVVKMKSGKTMKVVK